MKKIGVIILLLAVCIASFMGCGDSKQTGGQESTKAEQAGLTAEELSNPEKMLSKEEAEELMGEQIKDPEVNNTNNPMGQITIMYSVESEVPLDLLSYHWLKNSSCRKN